MRRVSRRCWADITKARQTTSSTIFRVKQRRKHACRPASKANPSRYARHTRDRRLDGSGSALGKRAPDGSLCAASCKRTAKVVGGTFGAPGSSVAPPAFAGLPPGTECDYTAGGAGGKVVFIVYVDPSAATAKETFAKLTPYYGVKSSPPHLGDTAYVDQSNAIHVLKGKVRFYINVTPTPSDRELIELAAWVAGQL